MFEELLAVVRRLREECPWDKKQTVESTRPLLLNEAYELDEALASSDKEHTAEELGDYLFMGLFLAEVLRKEQDTRLEDVLSGIVAKLKNRHPHVYGETKVKDANEVVENWERIKCMEPDKKGMNRQARQERQGADGSGHGGPGEKSILEGLPRVMPALKQAQLVQERCKRVGFDWSRTEDVLDKVTEETDEVRQELKKHDHARLAEELGDLFFALVNLCRHLGLDAESVLRGANTKFRKRFQLLEQEFRSQGKSLAHCTLEEMDRVWEQIKHEPH